MKPSEDQEFLLDWITKQTKLASEHVLSNYRRWAIAGFLLLTAGVCFALWLSQHDVATQKQLRQAQTHNAEVRRSAQVSSCKRVNILRAQSNLSNLVSFRILVASGQQQLRLVKRDPAHRKQHQRAAEFLLNPVRYLDMTSLTNCKRAVDSPDSYRFPLAGPIGNPKTGKLSPEITRIVLESHRLVLANRKK